MADIAINPVTRRVQFTGNTGTGPFAFTFNILADEDIAVYKNTTLLTLTTDYSVTTNANGTGSITLVAGQALISSDVLTIIGGRDLSRTTDFVTAGDLLASSLNEQLDSLVIMTQQLDEKVGRTIKTNPGDVYTDLELPTKDNRKGTVLGFNATSGDPEVGPTIADVSSLASITADIATLADIEDGTDATDAIQTVAGISANVTTVAGISANVTTVAGNTSNINAVVADEADIGTVAGSISNVNTVAGIDSNITTVAGNTTNINTVAGNNSNITTVAGVSANVTTVAGISSDVTTVAGISSDVTTVAADGTDIGTVATNIADVNTVASNIGTISAKVSKSGDTMTGDLTIQGNLTVSGTTITVDSATAQTIDLGDGDRMRFGDSNDAYIEWNGTYFDLRSTGRFDLLSSGNDLRLSTATNVGLIVNHTGGTPAVQLYNSGVERLATTSTGVDITGTLTSDGLTFDQALANPTNSTATIYNQSGVGPTLSGYKNEFRTGATPVSRMEISNNGDISFYEDTGTTAKFFWDASAESLGIGTTTLTHNLEIREDINGIVGARITNPNSGSSAYSLLYFGSDTNTVHSGIFQNSSTNSNYGGANSLNIWTNSGSYPIAFHTNNTERMRIDSSGNVGIGTSSPSAKLHLQGSTGGYLELKMEPSADTDVSSIAFRNAADNQTKGYVLYDHTSNYMGFRTNGSGEAMRIDSSGNLLVGKTALNTNSIGLQLESDGYLSACRDGGNVALINRKTSDGALVTFQKDGTTVGSIGSRSGVVTSIILDPRSGGTGLTGGYQGVFPTSNTGAINDAHADLGGSSNRFRNLYLSGGVYLGGTGAANKLDDYEEGTFDAGMVPSNSGTITLNPGVYKLAYTKVGRKVHIQGLLETTSKSSPVGTLRITGLPFTAVDGAHYSGRAGGAMRITNVEGTGFGVADAYSCYILESGNILYVDVDASTVHPATTPAYSQFYISISYNTT